MVAKTPGRKFYLPLEPIEPGDRLELTRTGEIVRAVRVFGGRITIEKKSGERRVLGLNQVTYAPTIKTIYKRALYFRGRCPDRCRDRNRQP